MSPEIAVDVLRRYRSDFRPAQAGDEPWSAMSVLAFASDDAEAIAEFEAGWALTLQNLARNVRTPLRPEEVRAYATSEEFRRARSAGVTVADDRMVTGSADAVVARLLELRSAAQVDEVVVVTPSIGRDLRIASYEAIARAWPA